MFLCEREIEGMGSFSSMSQPGYIYFKVFFRSTTTTKKTYEMSENLNSEFLPEEIWKFLIFQYLLMHTFLSPFALF